jgi:DNA-binding transcriptional LysR family regulator
MLEELRGLVVFAQLAEVLSFSKAAERLGMTRSAVSKHIANLERQLGAQLLVRTTRKISLTEAGERVRPMAAQIAESVELSREAARGKEGSMAGHLRIAAPSLLGRSYLVELVTRFLAEHPQVTAELVLADAYVDIVSERIDVALRVGRFIDSTLVARRVAKVEALLCAAPAYLERMGAPRSPGELTAHEFVSHVPSSLQNRLTFHRGARSVTVRTSGRLSCNDGAASVEATVQGFGMIVAPAFELSEQVKSGALVRVLPGWSLGEFTLHALTPPRRHVPSKVRAFVDFVLAAWRVPPWRLS